MSYDEEAAARVRRILSGRSDVVEKRMFGGLCFMVNGGMCCGLTNAAFMVRVGPDQYEDALAQPHVRPMDFTGRPLAGLVYVDPSGYSGRICGNRITSRMLALSVSSITRRSMPMPSPAVGGRPCSSARM